MPEKILILTACIALISLLQAIDVQIERAETHYVDKEYYEYVNVRVRRQNRQGPYLIYTEILLLNDIGNNVSVAVQLFENLSGRYLPTLVKAQWKLCDFFNNEPYIGQVLKRQFPSNLTCPHRAGLIVMPAVKVQFDKFPYVVPLTWPFKMTSVRCDLTWMLTESKKPITIIYIYAKIAQNSGAKNNKTL